MRKQFLNEKLPSGIGKIAIDSFLIVAQEWERTRALTHVPTITCLSS